MFETAPYLFYVTRWYINCPFCRFQNGSRIQKEKDQKAYTPEDLLNAVKESALTLRKAHQKYKIPFGTLSNQVKGKGKGSSNAGHPTVFSKETELLMTQHLACLGEWGYPFDILDVRMFA